MMKLHFQKVWKPFLNLLGLGLLSLPLLLYGLPHFQRPPRTNETRSLFQGISYQRQVRTQPRPLVLHLVKVDLAAPGVGVLVTPGQVTSDETDTTARTTSEFLTEFKLQLAVNANFFAPFREDFFWDYYPRSGDRVNALAQATSQGQTYSQGWAQWAALCFIGNPRNQIQRAQIVASGTCPPNTQQAVAGNEMLIADGQPVQPSEAASFERRPYARTVAALDATGKTLWLIAVDGKQPHYSEGVTRQELIQQLMQFGVQMALNLDGGGSTTLVMATPQGAQLLNAPIHAKVPLQERPIATHLGFYAKAQNPP